tara:strand:+ start:264 stop:1469 length:1206 start_codon:yes stop_codon:yes gene_type:complete
MFRGTLFAQVIAIIGAIFMAKIYGEEAYGIFGVFISIISIVSVISTLQLDKCIVISKDNTESTNWFNFLLVLIPVLTFLISALLFVFSIYFFQEKLNLNLIFLSLIGALLLSFNLVNENLFTFKKKFSTLSNSKIFLTISNITFQFLLYYYFNLFGLILGFLISQFLLLLFYFFKNSNVISKSNLKEIKKGIKKNNTIVKYLLPSSATNAIANNLMPILILTFFGAKEAGVYFFSLKILGTPLFLISSSVSNVFFQKSSELLNENKTELLKLTKKIVSINLILMLAFLILVNTIGMTVLESIFNHKWNNLRSYSLILSILILGRSAFSPISSLVVVLNKNLESLIFNSYLFIVNLVAIYFGYLYNDITITILILAIFGGVGYISLLAYFLNHLKTIVKNNV